MALEKYGIIYTLGNLFMAYVIYKYIHIFYAECKINAHIERIAYLGYFAVITLTHIIFKIPLLVFFTNMIIIFLISLLYVGGIRKAVLSSVIICFSLMCVETIIAYLTSFITLNPMAPFEYKFTFGIITIRIVSYAFVLVVNRFKNIRKEYSMPNVYWLNLITVPIGTIIMLFAIFAGGSISKSLMVICIISALSINIFTFYLYDKISELLVSQMNERIMEEQNRYYKYQVQMMKSTLENMRVLRHDLKNKLSPLYGLASAGRSEELAAQLAELTDICCINKEYSNSGNSTIDSIINFKLQQVEAEGIAITTDIFVPSQLSIETFDIAVVLGNLIDNALEAVVKAENRWIDLKAKYSKGRLVIKIVNSYDGVVKKTDNHFYSRKEDTANHGMGLKSIQAVLQKYDGAMQISHNEKAFKVKLLMYCNSVF
ncbi:sensor histidine kinase [Brassicibacter mesophilus]|uniref:sensor histidine kinase n=1 Tax=Brassicibacter mesophilus TaxID=745119 RepID=UPI003D19F66B